MLDSDFEIVQGYVVGMIGDIIRLHADYYHKHWGLGLNLEVSIAHNLAEFFQNYDVSQDSIWSISREGRIVAAIIIDGSIEGKDEARLRFFIVHETLQGKGIGRRLIQTAINFCDNKAFKRVTLKTFEGLDSARHLYESYGFSVYNQAINDGQELFYERHYPNK